MAYISKNEVKNIREKLKKEFPKYKFSVTNKDGLGIDICLISSDLDLKKDLKKGYLDTDREQQELERIENGYLVINPYSIKDKWNGKTLEVFEKTLDIAKSQGWYDKTDSRIDYFDTAYYIDINFGKYDRPHQVKENI